jgi:putative flippase GtrA
VPPPGSALVLRALPPRIERFVRSEHFGKLWRYAAVSVVSTVTTLVLLYIFFRGFHLRVFWANVLATAIATVPSFYLNRNWAWGKSGRSHVTREIIPFWVIAFIGLVLSTWAVDAGDRLAHHLNAGHTVETLMVLGANFATYAVIWVGKFILFNKVLFVDHRRHGAAAGGASAAPHLEPAAPPPVRVTAGSPESAHALDSLAPARAEIDEGDRVAGPPPAFLLAEPSSESAQAAARAVRAVPASGALPNRS